MRRKTVRAGKHWIEVELHPHGWEIQVIPMTVPRIPVDKAIVATHKEMLQWVLTHTGQYVSEAISDE